MNDVTPYPAINTVLTEWAEGLKRLLGKKIVGLYLSGSLAYGDFVPDRSDIDLQAVVQNPLTQDELGLVEQLHRKVERRYPQFASSPATVGLISGFCSSARIFAPRFFQAPPRDECYFTLALRYDFTSIWLSKGVSPSSCRKMLGTQEKGREPSSRPERLVPDR